MSELYLSHLRLNPRRHEVRRILANGYTLHQRVMTAFPDTSEAARDAFGVLHRVDVDPDTGSPTLLVQSTTPPDWARANVGSLLAAGAHPEVKEISTSYDAITPGALLRFRLRANPTRRVHAGHRNDPLAGKRVNLRTDEQRQDWIERKVRDAGCQLIGCVIRDEQTQRGTRHGMRLSHGAVVFDGGLHVIDPQLLRTALRQGIGSGKAFGFGLLSVAPARA